MTRNVDSFAPADALQGCPGGCLSEKPERSVSQSNGAGWRQSHLPWPGARTAIIFYKYFLHLALFFAKPSQCTGINCSSEERSELSFLLVENYQLTASVGLTVDREFLAKKSRL